MSNILYGEIKRRKPVKRSHIMKKLFTSLFSLLLVAAFCLSSATPAAASENPAEKLPYFVYFSSEKPYNKYIEVCDAPFRKTIDEKKFQKQPFAKSLRRFVLSPPFFGQNIIRTLLIFLLICSILIHSNNCGGRPYAQRNQIQRKALQHDRGRRL